MTPREWLRTFEGVLWIPETCYADLERELAEAHKAIALDSKSILELRLQLTRSEARCARLEMAVRSLGFCNQCNGTGTAVYGPCQICGAVGLDHRAQAALATEGDDRGYPNTGRDPESAP